MIPKIIHYCWFGRKPLPKSARKCIASWRKYLPDYEIKEWNEDNFDVNIIPYTADSYKYGKYAYVSDYARFYILYHYGGVYFDTDVEVVKPMDDIIADGAFMGIEQSAANISINPGLVVAGEAGLDMYKEIIELYHNSSFFGADGTQQSGLVVRYTTEVMQQHGFILKNEKQKVAGITIYPNEYFNPLEDATGRLTVTENTRSIHWYSKTWADNYGPLRIWLTRLFHRCFGINFMSKFRK